MTFFSLGFYWVGGVGESERLGGMVTQIPTPPTPETKAEKSHVALCLKTCVVLKNGMTLKVADFK